MAKKITLYDLPVKTFAKEDLLDEMRKAKQDDVFVIDQETIAVIKKVNLLDKCPHTKTVLKTVEVKSNIPGMPDSFKEVEICTKCDKELNNK